MAIDFVTRDVARAIYEYADKHNELPPFKDLPPTVQISYIEEAEAALRVVCDHMIKLSKQAMPVETQPYVVSVITALAESLHPETKGHQAL